jgi:hypothetical protein
MEDKYLRAKIEDKRVLVIADVHQDTSFFQKVLNQEEGKFDILVFLGDWFDSHHPKFVSGIKETCFFINNLREKYDCRFIVGNHDLSYYDSYIWYKRKKSKCLDLPFYCSGYTTSKAKKVSKYLNKDVIEESFLIVEVNGWLLSHAGINKKLWPVFYGNNADQEAKNKLIEKSIEVFENFRADPENGFFWVSKSRGGRHPYGGVIWQDWDEEFEDSLPYPQVVGHTYSEEPRQKGSSWCIDCAQSYYAIIEPSSEIKIKKVENANSRKKY